MDSYASQSGSEVAAGHIIILDIILDTDHDLNLYLGPNSCIQIMILNLALQASFVDPFLSLIKIHFGTSSNPLCSYSR
jgi:hypothetical protein